MEHGSYRTIRLLEHAVKVIEHVFEIRIRKMLVMLVIYRWIHIRKRS